jgi:hypothetical protein
MFFITIGVETNQKILKKSGLSQPKKILKKKAKIDFFKKWPYVSNIKKWFIASYLALKLECFCKFWCT